MKHGNVLIITNAETGWVELSCKKFMPRVQPYLQNLRVLSARSAFEALYPDSPSDWKVSPHAAVARRSAHRPQGQMSLFTCRGARA